MGDARVDAQVVVRGHALGHQNQADAQVAVHHAQEDVRAAVQEHQNQADAQVAAQPVQEDVRAAVLEHVLDRVQELQLELAIVAVNNVSSIAVMVAIIHVTNFVTQLATTHVMLPAIVHVIIQTVHIITVVDAMELVIIYVELNANQIVLDLAT